MAKQNGPGLVRMLGNAGWCDLSDDYRGSVRRGILRDRGNTLVLDIEFAGRNYDVQLQRQGGDRFEGTWARPKSAAVTGIATATRYTSSEGDLLFGEWREDGKIYHWWVQLTVVDQFEN